MRLTCLFFLVFFLTSCQHENLKAVKILKLFDGDSFLAEDFPCHDCKSFQVRLLGMDAPEGKQAPWGDRARDKLASMIAKDGVIYLEYDLQKYDKYKRQLAFAFADANAELLINEKMIATGSAELFAFSNDLKYLSRFKEAERQAKNSNLGIWQLENGLELSPSEYRKGKKKKL